MTPPGPRVRVVVVNYNGGDLTIAALHSLLATDWPAEDFELVLVDNASTDGVAARVAKTMPRVRVIRSAENRGFAGGNNVALGDLGDLAYVALVNPDVVVEPGWLRPLAEVLSRDDGLGAACPKIVLSDRYAEVIVRRPSTTATVIRAIRVGDNDVTERVHVAKGDGAFATDVVFPASVVGDLRIRVPVSAGASDRVELDIIGDDEPVIARITNPFDVINNVGNVFREDGYAADRGYLEEDAGQYDDSVDVFAWCGAAVLLRRDYLDDVGLFDERLFLYFEDFELSWRGSARGWRYRYVPGSVVRHRHGATTSAGSRLWEYYNSRNRLLVLTRHAPWPQVRRALLHQVAVTATRAREDVRELAGDRAERSASPFERLRRRARALAGYVRYAPGMVMSRRRDRTALPRRSRDRPEGTTGKDV